MDRKVEVLQRELRGHGGDGGLQKRVGEVRHMGALRGEDDGDVLRANKAFTESTAHHATNPPQNQALGHTAVEILEEPTRTVQGPCAHAAVSQRSPATARARERPARTREAE